MRASQTRLDSLADTLNISLQRRRAYNAALASDLDRFVPAEPSRFCRFNHLTIPNAPHHPGDPGQNAEVGQMSELLQRTLDCVQRSRFLDRFWRTVADSRLSQPDINVRRLFSRRGAASKSRSEVTAKPPVRSVRAHHTRPGFHAAQVGSFGHALGVLGVKQNPRRLSPAVGLAPAMEPMRQGVIC